MNASRVDLALMALRLVLGAAFVAHGYPKIQHPFTWTAHVLPSTPHWIATATAVGELGCGIALIVGLFTRIAAFALAAGMVVAIFLVLLPHGAGFVTSGAGPGFERPLLYLTVAFAIVMMGPGTLSADGLRSPRGAVASTRGRKRRR